MNRIREGREKDGWNTLKDKGNGGKEGQSGGKREESQIKMEGIEDGTHK